MTYRLYAAPDSANIVIQMILEELGLEHEVLWVNRAVQEHRKEPYLSLNPQGLIPVLLDGDTPIYETAAIALHLSDRAGKLAPQKAGSPERATFLQWLFWISNSYHSDLRTLFYSHRHVAACEGGAEDLTAAQLNLLEGTKERLCKHITMVEKQLSKSIDGPFLFGSKMTVADLYLGACSRWLMLYPAKFPSLPQTHPRFAPNRLPYHRRLLSALEALPSVHRALGSNNIKPPFFLDPTGPNVDASAVLGE